ncbi:hypothetical protein ACFV0T_15150 [Streptomyces sp. NPDC059582]|uniref:hypothetical protein n=1 Tax=Streptomyces sp. NPDC059582 TaxID=3346875 RepID=UPI0036892229
MKGPAPTHLAGWLFADLLLVLVLIVLGGQSIHATEAEDPDPSPGASASAPTTSVTSASPAKPSPNRSGMDPVSRNLPLLTDQSVADALRGPGGAAHDKAVRRIAKEVDRVLAGEKRRGAMIFVWGTDGGCANCAATSGPSTTYAEAAAKAIQQSHHPLLPRATAFYRGYIKLSGASGTLRMEVFFYYS